MRKGWDQNSKPGIVSPRLTRSVTRKGKKLHVPETQSCSFHDFRIVFKNYELPDIPELALP